MSQVKRNLERWENSVGRADGRLSGRADRSAGRFRELSKPDIQAALSKRETALSDKLEVTVERIVEELATMGFAPLNHETVKVANKRAALVDLGMFVDRSERKEMVLIVNAIDGAL